LIKGEDAILGAETRLDHRLHLTVAGLAPRLRYRHAREKAEGEAIDTIRARPSRAVNVYAGDIQRADATSRSSPRRGRKPGQTASIWAGQHQHSHAVMRRWCGAPERDLSRDLKPGGFLPTMSPGLRLKEHQVIGSGTMLYSAV
jgi:hypothetical protein